MLFAKLNERTAASILAEIMVVSAFAVIMIFSGGAAVVPYWGSAMYLNGWPIFVINVLAVTAILALMIRTQSRVPHAEDVYEASGQDRRRSRALGTVLIVVITTFVAIAALVNNVVGDDASIWIAAIFGVLTCVVGGRTARREFRNGYGAREPDQVGYMFMFCISLINGCGFGFRANMLLPGLLAGILTLAGSIGTYFALRNILYAPKTYVTPQTYAATDVP